MRFTKNMSRCRLKPTLVKRKYVAYCVLTVSLERDFALPATRAGLKVTLPHIHFTEHGNRKGHLPGSLLERCITFYADDFWEPGY